MPVVVDHSGKRFGRMLLLRRIECKGPAKYLCLCDCGKKKICRYDHMHYGKIVSCRCFQEETISTHGETTNGKPSPELKCWYGMKDRCFNPRSDSYKNYGGRGITVDVKWVSSYERFLTDMGRRPGKGFSIDRINNDGNYEPGNCRWATTKQQAANQRRRNQYIVKD